ncbi:MAG: S41 family peptidase [Betaproteobacteria bacterium]
MALLSATPAIGQSASGMVDDFDVFCRFVADDYAYFDSKTTQWDKACAALRPQAERATDRNTLIPILESALAELYDAHAHVGASIRTSPRLVPTGAELWVEWEVDAAIIREIREGSPAFIAGVRPGMRIVAIDGQPIAEALRERQPHFLRAPDAAARSWTLQSVVAGRQNGEPVRLTIEAGGTTRVIDYVPANDRASAPLSARRLDVGIVVIRFNNSLGDDATVAAFDAQVDAFKDARGLILDLRDTPSGGTSMVARGIMSRLIGAAAPYQVHELIAEARASGIRRRWIEYVMPRGQRFAAPVVVLVGRWTSSMGEGLAIGLNAVRGAPVIGTPMAHLLGALEEIKLPRSGLVVRIPTEQLFHVDGTPREAFVPCAVPIASRGTATDHALDAAVAWLAHPPTKGNARKTSKKGSGCVGTPR